MRSTKFYTVGLLGLLATGCNDVLGNQPGKPVDSVCEWLADECNCYRRFAAGVANSTVDAKTGAGQKPMCGVQLDSTTNAIDSATQKLYEPQSDKPTSGSFLDRDKLDICVITGTGGGQIVFDPPLDVDAFPPANFNFKMLDASGQSCGNGSFASPTSFSIGFAAPDGAAGSSSGLACRAESDADHDDPGRAPISSGTFSMVPTDPTNVVTTTCPNDETYQFNLVQLDRCDGAPGKEAYKDLLPTAEIEASAGGIGVPGEVRLRIFWPRSEPVESLDGAKPIAVEYFDCAIPSGVDTCQDGKQDGLETDVDCGNAACGIGCPDGSPCLDKGDCLSGICAPNAAGLKVCAPTQCGDGAQDGAETCDDGNAQAGDGCSADCAQEPGYRCMGVGPGSCIDIGECEEMIDNCDASATCINLPGSFLCACPPGFSGDGIACTAGCGDSVKVAPEQCDDANQVSGDGCSENCVPEPGYMCMGAGPGSCIDINECATMKDNCLDTEDCVNTSGSFTCTCKPGNLMCSGVCLDVSADVFNCDACAKVCLPGQVCTAGACVSAP